MPCRPPRLAKSSSTDWPTRLVIGPLQGYRRPDLENRNATAAVIGAGDFIGAAIAKKFASEGFTVFAGRRHGDKLAPLVAEIEAAGGRVVGRSLDARKEEEITAFLQDADMAAPLEVCIFNVGANVNFPLLETTERVFRKVWEMACYAGFLTAREAARLMLPRGRGNIFFTGATAGTRGGVGYAAFASAWVRERIKEREGEAALANLDPGRLMRPASVAEAYWQIYQEPRDAWSFEREIRPFAEKW